MAGVESIREMASTVIRYRRGGDRVSEHMADVESIREKESAELRYRNEWRAIE